MHFSLAHPVCEPRDLTTVSTAGHNTNTVSLSLSLSLTLYDGCSLLAVAYHIRQ